MADDPGYDEMRCDEIGESSGLLDILSSMIISQQWQANKCNVRSHAKRTNTSYIVVGAEVKRHP